MSLFTENELRFLSKYNFSENEVYDGRYETKTSREASAKAAGKTLVLTSVPCRQMGHRIRTRKGHCAQCKPTNIAFTARETASGNVYIAGSLSGRVIKIGVTTDIPRRERQLRTQGYGGFSDWIVLIHVEVNDAGAVERAVSANIKGKRINNGYFKDGLEQMAIEVIQCSFSEAFKALADSIGGIGRPRFWLERNREYEFD